MSGETRPLPSALEGTRPPREGEGLDLARVGPWLREVLGAPPDAAVHIGQFPGGHSNLTYAAVVGDREVVLRRPPVGAVARSAHDMGREWRVLSALAPRFPLAPRPIAYCDDQARLGSKLLVMERRRGVIVRREWPRELVSSVESARRLCDAMVDALVALHAFDWRAAGLGPAAQSAGPMARITQTDGSEPDTKPFGKPEGFVARQVAGWTGRYGASQTDSIADMDALALWLPANQPHERADAAVLHNDFKFDNLVLDPESLSRDLSERGAGRRGDSVPSAPPIAGQGAGVLRAILDWEMAAVGDPWMDVGTSLSYWVEAGDPAALHAFRFGPTHLPGMMTRAELANAYAEKSGRTTSHAVFYAAFGLFKTAVVAQQIYARFARGQTKDARFGEFIEGVRVLARRAAHTIERGEV